MDKGCGGQTGQCVAGQPLREWGPNPFPGFCALAGGGEPLICCAIL